jgi:hypothetical protein
MTMTTGFRGDYQSEGLRNATPHRQSREIAIKIPTSPQINLLLYSMGTVG